MVTSRKSENQQLFFIFRASRFRISGDNKSTIQYTRYFSINIKKLNNIPPTFCYGDLTRIKLYKIHTVLLFFSPKQVNSRANMFFTHSPQVWILWFCCNYPHLLTRKVWRPTPSGSRLCERGWIVPGTGWRQRRRTRRWACPQAEKNM